MPKVPLYNQRVKTAPVADTRLNERATPEAFGAGLGKGIQDVGAVGADFAKKAFDNANRSAYLDAQNQFESQLSPITAEAKQVRGKDALELPNKVLPKVDAIGDKISAGLANDEQRRMFQEYKAGRKVDTQKFLDDHGQVEWSNYQEQQFDDNGKLFNLRIAQVGNDPAQANNAIWDRQTAIKAHAEASGKSPEWVKLQTQQVYDSSGAQIVSGLANAGDYQGAKKQLERYSGVLSKPVSDKLGEVVEQATIEGVSKEVAADISANPKFNTEHPDMTAVVEMVNGASLDKLGGEGASDLVEKIRETARSKTVRIVNQRAAGITDTQNGLEYQILSIAYDSNNPLKEQNPKIGPLYNQLDPVRQEKLRRMFAKPDKAETDAEKYASAVALDGYEQLVSNPDPKTRQEFLNKGPPKPGDVVQGKVLNSQDAIKALALWRTGMDSFTNPKAKRDIETLQTKHEAVGEVFRAAGVSIAKDKEENFKDEKAAALYDYVNREVARLQSQRKDQTPLGSEDYRQVAKQALGVVKMQQMGLTGAYEGETTAGEAARNTLRQIPPDIRSKIEDKFFEHEGRRPTATEAINQYKNYLKANPPAPAQPTESGGVMGFLGDLWKLYS